MIMYISFLINIDKNKKNATPVCKDANSILVEVVTVADVDDEHRVGNSLLQI